MINATIKDFFKIIDKKKSHEIFMALKVDRKMLFKLLEIVRTDQINIVRLF